MSMILTERFREIKDKILTYTDAITNPERGQSELLPKEVEVKCYVAVNSNLYYILNLVLQCCKYFEIRCVFTAIFVYFRKWI